MRQYKLVLYPCVPDFTQLESGAIINALKNGGLISGATHHDAYLTGDAFIELFSFLGCAPNICLTPADGDNFCHVIIRSAPGNIHCLGHTATAIPRCPHCKHKMIHWQQTENWQLGETVCTCSHCNTATAMQNLDWKQECAYGRMAVDIINIHPFEAVPSDNLLHILQAATNVEWRYCYAENKK
jgi:hypothetical protein